MVAIVVLLHKEFKNNLVIWRNFVWLFAKDGHGLTRKFFLSVLLNPVGMEGIEAWVTGSRLARQPCINSIQDGVATRTKGLSRFLLKYKQRKINL